MKKIVFGILTGLILVYLTGCGESAKTTEYYKSHLEEAKIRVAECKKLEKINETQQLDCENANEALLSKRTIKAF
ncbi:EexN family lipoprotein [Campylobacter coli]|nr:EexN family lipoprotein [Campylobacter coli]EFV4750357.1 EexN family lipoprotein [Campylobacter coli]